MELRDACSGPREGRLTRSARRPSFRTPKSGGRRLGVGVWLLAFSAPPAAHAEPQTTSERALVDVGRSVFFDATLSEPRGTSCASCHDPGRAFAGNHGSTLGVPRGSRPGHFA